MADAMRKNFNINPIGFFPIKDTGRPANVCAPTASKSYDEAGRPIKACVIIAPYSVDYFDVAKCETVALGGEPHQCLNEVLDEAGRLRAANAH